MRRLGFPTIAFALASCFNGDAAKGLPCDNAAQCGVGQQCIDNVCGGPVGATASSETASSSTGADNGSTGSGTSGGMEGMCAEPFKPVCRGRAVVSLEFTQRTIGDGGQNAVAVVAGEFVGGDGVVDLAVLNYYSADLTLHRWNPANADFMMEPGIASDLGVPLDLAAGDLDCDGDDDLAAVNPSDSMIHVVWGNTAQPLTEQTAQGFGDGGHFSVAIADFVDDPASRPELAAAGDSLRLVQWPASGPTLFDFFPTNVFEPWGSLAADLDGDGRPEMIVTDSDSSNLREGTDPVRIFPVSQTGIGTPVDLLGFENPYGVAVLDVDGDQDVDLAVIEKRINLPPEESDQIGYLTICINDGDLDFTCQEPIDGPVGTTAIVAADIDCDGTDDLVVAGATMAVLFRADVVNPGSFTATPLPATLFSAGTRMAVADFDGNGYLDVAIPDFGDLRDASRVVVLLTQEGA